MLALPYSNYHNKWYSFPSPLSLLGGQKEAFIVSLQGIKHLNRRVNRKSLLTNITKVVDEAWHSLYSKKGNLKLRKSGKKI
jgi:hypothetical protein